MGDKLALDSPRWSTLKTIYGYGTGIPTLINAAITERGNGVGDAYQELLGSVYDLYSACQATYAVVPYLVELANSLAPVAAGEVWTDLGHIAATHDVDRDLAPSDLLQSFRSALVRAEGPCLQALYANTWSAIESYYLTLAAISFTGHPLGYLVTDRMSPTVDGDLEASVDSDLEASAFCTKCGRSFDVAFFRNGIALSDMEAPTLFNPGGLPAEPKEHAPGPRRDPNPWQIAGNEIRSFIHRHNETTVSVEHFKVALQAAEEGLNPTSEAGHVFCVIGAVLATKGYPSWSPCYFHALDRIKCPSCGCEIAFADHWLGLKEKRRTVFSTSAS